MPFLPAQEFEPRAEATRAAVAAFASKRGVMRMLYATLLLLASICRASAALTTPVGSWRTFDDDGHESGRVQIFEQDSLLYGRIVGIVDPAKASGRCGKCSDDRKDQPALGLQILRGMHADGDRRDKGEILDPETGSTYRCTMRLQNDGQQLIVRGFVGVSLFGRSQTWLRAE